MATEINKIPLRAPSTKPEQMLLGFVIDEASRIQYGKIVIEVTVRNGKLASIQSTEIKRTAILE